MLPPAPNEEDLFHRALALPASDRAAFLARECAGNDRLRGVIETLLRLHTKADGFLSGAAPEASATVVGSLLAQEKTGDWIGRYKLLQKIGEGGCGAVYMAEQEEPVRRRVALKVIKLGMDTHAVIARFEAERQALALMDHPNIAKVLDAGATENGRPFFVMELVRGMPVTKYCDAHNVSTADRLQLFIQICQAIQHAHQKGIIHRDIKPSNILVTVNDGEAVPKVIDFGIAKATQGKLTDATLFTAFEQFIGTPAYMSPEQAAMTSLDIDTRSDIYSLGVLLYELLAGRPPFDPKEFLSAGLDEMRRIIREVEPPKPSTRLSTLAAGDRATIAKLRGAAPAQLTTQLSGDLDWIVMKALDKNRTRRYESASAFAADIQRHLVNEPVIARPPSAAYLLQKLVRRHRVAVGAAGAVVGALIIGLCVATWAYFREKAAHEVAADAVAQQLKAGKTSQETLIKLRDLQRQLQAVEKQRASDVLGSEVTLKLARSLLPSADAALDPAERERWKKITDELAGLLEANTQTLPAARHEWWEMLGDTCMALGDFARAETMFRTALELRRQHLGEAHATTATLVEKLAAALRRQGKTAAADQTRQDGAARKAEYLASDRHVNALRDQADALSREGRFAEAEQRVFEAAAIVEKRGQRTSRMFPEFGRIAWIRFKAGDVAAAKQLAQQWLDTDKDERGWAEAMTNFSIVRGGYHPPRQAHTLLGLIALHEGDRRAAERHLLLTIDPEGTFWFDKIDTRLAAAMAAAGEFKAVEKYLAESHARYAEMFESEVLRFDLYSGDWESRFRHVALGREQIALFDEWRAQIRERRVPETWRPAPIPAPAAATEAKLPPLSTRPVPKREIPPWLTQPPFPIFVLLLGWFSGAVLPAVRRAPATLPSGKTRWLLLGFCLAQLLDGAYFAAALLLDNFQPNGLVGFTVSLASWTLLWELIRSLAPELSTHRETRLARGTIVLAALLAYGAFFSPLIGASPRLEFVTILLLGLSIILMFVLSISISTVAGPRLFRWARRPGATRAQTWLIGAAAPLLVMHGLTYVILPLIEALAGKSWGMSVLWANALLPWLLVGGFYSGWRRAGPDAA